MKPQKSKQKVSKDISMEESEAITNLMTAEELESIKLNRYSVEELAALRNKKKRELAKAEREQRQAESEMRLLESIRNRLSGDREVYQMNLNEITRLRTDLQKAKEITTGNTESLDELITICNGLIGLQNVVTQTNNKIERVVRIHRNKIFREHQCESPSETLCIICQKRPRHFDEYCKRCVPENLRPKGKVK